MQAIFLDLSFFLACIWKHSAAFREAHTADVCDVCA
jgi:hypothetical protein